MYLPFSIDIEKVFMLEKENDKTDASAKHQRIMYDGNHAFSVNNGHAQSRNECGIES